MLHFFVSGLLSDKQNALNHFLYKKDSKNSVDPVCQLLINCKFDSLFVFLHLICFGNCFVMLKFSQELFVAHLDNMLSNYYQVFFHGMSAYQYLRTISKFQNLKSLQILQEFSISCLTLQGVTSFVSIGKACANSLI